jgi:ATP-dependent RNA helicase SUPV3L1/SUV3
LRKYGVRFGAFNLYFPALLKPAAAELLLQLWALHGGADYGIDIDAMPERPQQGLTSVPANGALPEPYWRAAGFHVAGSRAVRIDMLERLSDLIRARVTWRPAPEAEAVTMDAQETPIDTATDAVAAIEANGAEAGPTPAETPSAPQPAPATKAAPETPRPPSGATGDGGFRVVPELMSMVGCSGEEFASILRGLGFRLERRKIEVSGETPVQAVAANAAPSGATAQAQGAVAAQGANAAQDANAAQGANAANEELEPEPVFDEIWRPSKRRHQQPRHTRGRGRNAGRANGQQAGAEAEGPQHRRGDQQGKPQDNRKHGKHFRKGGKGDRFGGQGPGRGKSQRKGQAKSKEWSSSPKRDQQNPDNSPFAALKDLRDSLAAKDRSGQS